MNSVWFKAKFVFEERYFSTNWLGIWTAFLLWGEGIWTSQSSKVQMPGGLPRGDVEASNWPAHNRTWCLVNQQISNWNDSLCNCLGNWKLKTLNWEFCASKTGYNTSIWIIGASLNLPHFQGAKNISLQAYKEKVTYSTDHDLQPLALRSVPSKMYDIRNNIAYVYLLRVLIIF